MSIWRIFCTVLLGRFIGERIANIYYGDKLSKLPKYFQSKFNLQPKSFSQTELLSNELTGPIFSKFESDYHKIQQRVCTLPLPPQQQQEQEQEQQQQQKQKQKHHQKRSRRSFLFMDTQIESNLLSKLHTLENVCEYLDFRDIVRDHHELAYKINEEFWKMLTTSFLTSVGLYVACTHRELFTDIIWTYWPQKYDPPMLFYYQLQGGYHASRFIWQLREWFSTTAVRRKDILVMTVHHVVTVVLIIASWRFGFLQIGALVFICHDSADVLLPAAKLSAWCKWHGASKFFFWCFAASWPVCRLFAFGYYVIRPVWYGGYRCCTCGISGLVNIWVLFVAMLVCLFVLHLFWTYFITKVAIRLIHNGTIYDSRAEGEQFEDEKERKMNKNKTM